MSKRRAAIGAVVALSAAAWFGRGYFVPPESSLLRASGTIEIDEVAVAAEVPGRLVTLSVDEGDRVIAGSAIGRLDDAILQVQARQAGPAERQLVDAQIDRLTLRSPIDGVIVKRLAHAGEVVGAGAPVVTVASLDELTVTVFVAEADLGRVRVGQSVTISADAFPGHGFPGRVRTIATRPEFTPRNISTQRDRQLLVFAIKVRIANPDRALKPGLPVDALFVE
jgi:multidrug resistance efflux pump